MGSWLNRKKREWIHLDIFVECIEDNKDYSKRQMRNLCDRMWLRDEFPFEVGWSKKFKLQSHDGTALEGHVLKKGIDQERHYILFLLDRASYYDHKKIERPRVSCGFVKVEAILSPEMITGAQQIVKKRNGSWPCFHEATLTIIERSNDNMILHFQGGFLEIPIELILNGIVSEDYGKNNLEYFTIELTSVEFRKNNESIEVLLCNDYILRTVPEGVDLSNLDDNLESIKPIETEFINHGIITCHSVEMKIIDTER